MQAEIPLKNTEENKFVHIKSAPFQYLIISKAEAL